MKLVKAVSVWGTPRFRELLKEEIEQQVLGEPLLQRALRYGNFLADQKPTAMIYHIEEHEDHVVVRLGLFFAGIDAGSCCANDPTAVEPHDEYCVIQMDIDLVTGDTQARLVDE